MANFNLNKVIIGGRLTRDPELGQTSTGIPVVRFSVAIDRRHSSDNQNSAQTADFISVVAWRQKAEFVCRYFKKGSSICVVGRLQSNSWTDANGKTQYSTDILADEINFVDSKNDSTGTNSPFVQEAASFSSGDSEEPKFEDVSNSDDLPF